MDHVHSPPSSCEPSESTGEGDIVMDYEYGVNDSYSSNNISSSNPQHPRQPHHNHQQSEFLPTRGVKPTSSLRRGAQAYSELLQSAVTASIQCQTGYAAPTAAPPPQFPPQLLSNRNGYEFSSFSKNKRSRRSSDNNFIVSRKQQVHGRMEDQSKEHVGSG